MRYILFLLVVLAFTGEAAARDFFVNNAGGDDGQNGAAPDTRVQGSGPVRTIRRALQLARKGDRVILVNTGEPYREPIALQGGNHSGLGGRPFQLIGNGSVIDGSVPVPDDDWEHVRGEIFRFAPERKSHQQLFFSGQPLKRIAASPKALAALEPFQWTLLDRKIHVRVEPDRLPQSYGFAYAGHSAGITLYNVRDLIISDVTVQGFQLDGINAHDGVSNVTVRQSICRGNGRSGISIGGASRLRVEACLVGNNGTAQVRTEGYCKTWLVNCDLIGNTAPKVVREGGRVIIQNDEPVLGAE